MNELIFFSFAIFLLCLNIFAFRAGKTYMYVLIAINVILMNIFVLKQFNLFGLAITGGNALYGSIFLLTDLLGEHHGKKAAYKGVWIGFGATALFVIALQVLLYFSPNEFDFAQESLGTLFTLAPRILLGSMAAYLVAQMLDVYLFSKIKKATKGKMLWLRNNVSTLISQFVDTMVFHLVGITTIFGIQGIIGLDIFWEVTLATYAIKVLFAFIDTPFMYLSYKVKKK